MIIVCANCGKEFEAKEFGDGLCSDECREATWVRRNNHHNRRKHRFLQQDKKSPKPESQEDYS